MCLAIDAGAGCAWRDDRRVALVLIDAEGDTRLLRGRRHRRDLPRPAPRATSPSAARFWRDEYRMNARLARISQAGRELPAGLHDGRRRRPRLPWLAPRSSGETPGSPCPNAASASCPTSAARFFWPARRAGWANISASPAHAWARATRSSRASPTPTCPRPHGAALKARLGRDRRRRRRGRGRAARARPRRWPTGRPRSTAFRRRDAARHPRRASAPTARGAAHDALRRCSRNAPLSMAAHARDAPPRCAARADHAPRRWSWNTASPRAVDGAGRLPRRHPRADHRQGPRAALAARRPGDVPAERRSRRCSRRWARTS